MTDNRPTCKTCIYRKPYGYAGSGDQCRRYPPTIDVSNRAGRATPSTEWPIVTQHDWCGEHKAQPVPVEGFIIRVKEIFRP